MSIPIGAQLGPYEIISLIGAGGMGEVYKARDTRLDRIVAIKVFCHKLYSTPEAKVLFTREAKAIAELKHPHICTLHDVGQHNEVLYLVMDCLEGVTLAYKIATEGALPVFEALSIAKEIAMALDTVQRGGLVHRDVKPSNIMLTETGAKLIDFDLASVRRRRSAEVVIDQEQALVGTIAYLPPEYLNGSDKESNVDIWAFGCTFYEMLAGVRLFAAPTIRETVQAILSAHPTPLPPLKFPRETPLDWAIQNKIEEVIKRCMASVARRYASDFVRRYTLACEIVKDLSEVEDLLSVAFVGSDGSTVEIFHRRKR